MPLALFLGATLFSAWFFPVFSLGQSSAAFSPPETALPGGMNGRTLLQSGEALDVKVAGVSDAHDIRWMLDGRLVGKAAELHVSHLKNGEHALSLTYRDSQNQLFAAASLVRVLEAGPYAVQVLAIQAAISLPLLQEDDQIFLPLIRN
jgi:hypothetical protein